MAGAHGSPACRCHGAHGARLKRFLLFGALLSITAPQHIRVPLGHYLSVDLLTSGLSYAGYGLAAVHPSALPFAARSPDADVGLRMYERIDLPAAPALGAVLDLRIPF